MDNEFDAFAEGIELGGLRNKTQIKLLLTYIINAVKEPVKREVVIDAVQMHGLANYFETAQALEAIIDNGNVSVSDDLLSITAKGIMTLGELSDELPRTVRETALADITKLVAVEKNETENAVSIERIENGYNVNFDVCHNGQKLLSVTVYAADLEQAQTVRRNFLSDPSKVYSVVIASLYVN